MAQKSSTTRRERLLSQADSIETDIDLAIAKFAVHRSIENFEAEPSEVTAAQYEASGTKRAIDDHTGPPWFVVDVVMRGTPDLMADNPKQ